MALATSTIRPRMKIEWLPWLKFFVEDAEKEIAERDHAAELAKEARKVEKAERI